MVRCGDALDPGRRAADFPAMSDDVSDLDTEPFRQAIAVSLGRVRGELDAAAVAAGRDPAAVRLVAVSKFHPQSAVRAALAAGQTVFGENRVQEAAAKFAPLRAEPTPFRLHIIGGLQTNKARDAVRVADVIETLDRPRLADAIAEAAEREGRLPDLLVQVNVGDEAQKGGVATVEADVFIASVQKRFGPSVRGLMCIPPAEGDPRPHFLWLQACAKRHGLAELSMGMSGDFAEAIACGATEVRVGTAIFGHRPDAGTADVPAPSL
jgi:PLP dependent protein